MLNHTGQGDIVVFMLFISWSIHSGIFSQLYVMLDQIQQPIQIVTPRHNDDLEMHSSSWR